VRGRNPEKPCVILIADVLDLALFGIDIQSVEVWVASKYWPGKVSAILPCKHPEMQYLHRGTNTLAFRIPEKPELRDILRETGPLIAPSANPEGEIPARTVKEAKKYFGKKVDFYADEGEKESEPSTLIKITGEDIDILRKGEAEIDLTI
jgi:L-threonylcarbamoyladenylate synthase